VEIRLKNGMPLMTAGGLIAGSQACCCGNPLCECFDFCQYTIEVVSPSAVAAKSLPYVCGQYAPNSGVSVDANEWPLGETVPLPFYEEPAELNCFSTFGFNKPGNRSASSLLVNDNRTVFAEAGVSKYYVTPSCSPPAIYIAISSQVRFTCTDLSTGSGFPTPTAVLYLVVHVRHSYQTYYGQNGPFSQYYRLKTLEVPLPATCSSNPNINCIPINAPTVQKKVISTPLSITVENNETSLGDWSQDSVVSDGPEASLCESIANQLLTAYSATYRITSRPNCDSPVACNCAASLGGMRVLLGNLKSLSVSPEYYEVDSSLVDLVQLDQDQTVSWQGPFGFYEYTQLDPDGPQDGDGNYTRRLWYQRAELYCDVIDRIAQWLVLFTSFRDIYNEAGTSTHRSYDQWAGKIDCFEACEDLDNYIDADESVPMGEPYDIEYLGRTTVTGYLECEPPPRLTIRFTQLVTC
jgi:hypothetical protein